MSLVIGALSDTHQVFQRLKLPQGCDLFLHSGDFTFDFGDKKTVHDFYNWLRSEAGDAHTALIPGNHDDERAVAYLKEVIESNADTRMHVLEHERLYIKELDITLFGSPYGTWNHPNPRFNRYGVTTEDLQDLWKPHLTPDQPVDILITHAPPFKVLDVDDVTSWGSATISTALTVLNPTLHAFGHMHKSSGHTYLDSEGKLTDRLSVNAAICGKSTEIKNPVSVIELVKADSGWGAARILNPR